ncbi:MAG: UDP-N-acetylglucosamine 1-carboxyvinyltransferase [Candidatus Peregrinibacteria bacterium]
MKSNFEKFIITGQKSLSGSVKISGSKNAALPILAASLAVAGVSTITNVPQISDTEKFLSMMESVGAKITQTGNTITVDATTLSFSGVLEHEGVKKMRASILLLAPLLVRFGAVKMEFPGGCVLGKRSVESHVRALRALGAQVVESEEYLHLKRSGPFTGTKIVLPEISVTATENALIAAASSNTETEIRLAAAEPHVQNLCEFLISAGAKIEGVGTHTLKITGPLKNSAAVEITSDYLEAGTFILAGVLTDSEITVEDVHIHHLDSFLEKLIEAGANIEYDEKKRTVKTFPKKSLLTATNIQTGVFPKFATDLHPQFAVLMTQCTGTSKIFETLFERKFAYLLELEKMGADVEIQNPHVFLIRGPQKLTGAPIASQDIRAGAAMLLAALIAKGESEISNIHYIDRGYPMIEEKLRGLGVEIKRV